MKNKSNIQHYMQKYSIFIVLVAFLKKKKQVKKRVLLQKHNELKDVIEQESKESSEKAEDTKQQSLDLYNQILDEDDEQK